MRRWHAARGQSAADEHSPVTIARSLKFAEDHQIHQRGRTIRATSWRVEIKNTLAAPRYADQFFVKVRSVFR